MKYIYEIFEDSEDGARLLADARLRRSFYTFLEKNIENHSLDEICKVSGISRRRMKKIVHKNPDLLLSEVAFILYSLGMESALCIEEYGSARSRHREVQSDNYKFTEIINNSYSSVYLEYGTCSDIEDDYQSEGELIKNRNSLVR